VPLSIVIAKAIACGTPIVFPKRKAPDTTAIVLSILPITVTVVAARYRKRFVYAIPIKPTKKDVISTRYLNVCSS
jgi:hypothetical protein